MSDVTHVASVLVVGKYQPYTTCDWTTGHEDSSYGNGKIVVPAWDLSACLMHMLLSFIAYAAALSQTCICIRQGQQTLETLVHTTHPYKCKQRCVCQTCLVSMGVACSSMAPSTLPTVCVMNCVLAACRSCSSQLISTILHPSFSKNCNSHDRSC